MIDIFLEIGHQHKVCEDYIISGNAPEPFIILSDGCSSSNNTEMGARILCHLAKQYLRYRGNDLHNIDHKKMGRWIIHNAEMTARQLGLTLNCLDATLMVSYFIDNRLYVFVYGDGVIVLKKGDEFSYYIVDFSNNAPYYLSYLIDDFRNDLYHQNKNSKFVKEIHPTHHAERTEECAYDFPLLFVFNKEEFDTLFISSDGITSFIDNNPTARTLHELPTIVPPFMDFKNTKGEYLKRRMKKALKYTNDMGIVHFDDLSIGAYHIE